MSSLLEHFSLGQVDGMREALARGEDVNKKNESNQTVLMFAAAASDCFFGENAVSILRLLLAQPSIEVNLADDQGKTALHVAAHTGNVAAVMLLLADERVDVNCKDNRQITPFIMAAGKPENIEIFKLLLADKRVEMNWVAPNPTNGDVTALMCAAWNSNVEAAKLLLDDPRVEVNWMNSRGMGVLHVAAAAQKNNLKLVELLLAPERVDVNCKLGPLGTTVLHMAAAKNNLEVTKLILAEPRFTLHNALVSLEERSALSIAAIKGNWDVLKELVHHPSIDLDVKHKNGLTVNDLLR